MFRLSLILMILLFTAPAAWATADGPDYWAVTGVDADDVLNMRVSPDWRSAKIGEIPPRTDGLANYGCDGLMSFKEFERATQEERDQYGKRIWCLVGHGDRIGWVAGRYLTEGWETTIAHKEYLGDLSGTEWLVVDLAGLRPGAEAMIAFDADRVHGSGGCNSFGASLITHSGGWRFGPVAATRKACFDASTDPDQISVAETEALFFEALGKTNEIVQGNETMVLLDAERNVMVTLQRVTGD